MIFDNLTLAALILFVLISLFLIGTKNRTRCKEGKPGAGTTDKSVDQ